MSGTDYSVPIYDYVPPGFTFDDYLAESPPVTGHIMQLMEGFNVSLPCKLYTYNTKEKTAVVEAADGILIDVVNIEEHIETLNVFLWGKVIESTTLQVKGHEPLKDDYDFESSAELMRELCRPKTWGLPDPTPEEIESMRGGQGRGSHQGRDSGNGGSQGRAEGE